METITESRIEKPITIRNPNGLSAKGIPDADTFIP